MVTRTWDGSVGAYGSAGDWLPAGVPGAGDTAVIGAGAVTVAGSDVAANVTLMFGGSAGSPTLTLQNAVIGASDVVDLGPGPSIGGGATSASSIVDTILSRGLVINAGAMTLSGGTTTLSIGVLGAVSGSLVNDGTITLEPGASIVGADGSDVDQLVNNGVVSTFRLPAFPVASYAAPSGFLVGVAVSGMGTIKVGGGFDLEFGGRVGAGQTVMLSGGAGVVGVSQFSDTVTIDDLTVFAGAIGGFGGSEAVVVTGPSYDGTQVSVSNGVTTLGFTQGGQVVGGLRFLGGYGAGQFVLSAAAVAGGRERISISFGAGAAGPTGPAGPVSVFRFFDRVHGTQFLTADAGEAAAAGGRGDLVGEGVGFLAVDPAARDVHGVQVYRFFDRVDGTHFFTASASERDAVIVSRPDLVFEPNSTFVEHATQQSGDVAVYRFFETGNGTHFYTSSAQERASIVAGRPDLVSEGVAFYAPSA